MAKHDAEKLISVISYCTLVGWIIAFVLNRVDLDFANWKAEKSAFVNFHLRQALTIGLFWMILGWIPVIRWITNIVFLVLSIYAAYEAFQYRKTEVPVLGAASQDWFRNL